MEDRIGDGRSSPYIAELANAFDPGRVYASILFGNQNDLQLSYIGVNGDEVIGQIVVDVARRTLIQLGRFMQRRSDTPDHAAHQLATRRAGVDNMSGRKRAHDAWNANFEGAQMNTYFDEFGNESKLDTDCQSR